MAATPATVLAINGGSSSLKFAVDRLGVPNTRSLFGKLEGVGAGSATLTWSGAPGERGEERFTARAHGSGVRFFLDWLEARPEFATVQAVGHRVVHGMQRSEPVRITPEILDELRSAVPFAPQHLPLEIETIEMMRDRHPDLPQVACFDTAFHAAMPIVARLLPIPRSYFEKGVRRYGFHGLSYEFLLEELARVAGREAANGRVILAHLGNGASLAAVKGGASLDTSMGFTPAAGLVMGTRPGDLDPGVAPYLATSEAMTPARFQSLVNDESGLLGVSEISSDVRELLACEASDARAAQALALFCHQARKWVGAFAAVLGGLDTLVFSAGIGENSASIRARVCEGLEFLGIELQEDRNAANAPVISTDAARVTVRVIATQEERMIVRSVSRLLGLEAPPTKSPS